MNKKVQTSKYLVLDYLAAVFAWSLFFYFRKRYIEIQSFDSVSIEYFDDNLWLALLILPFFWMLLYYIIGYYKNIYRKSRLTEFVQTLFVSGFGVLIIFFVLLLDDFIGSYKQYYSSLLTLFTLQFFITYIPRAILTTKTNRSIHKRKIGFNTLMVGSNEKALSLYKTLEAKPRSSGNKFVGFVNIIVRDNYMLSDYMPHLGSISDMKTIIPQMQIEEVIVAVESHEHDDLERIINKLEGLNVVVKAIPDNCDILTGKVKIASLYDEPLLPISHDLMPEWQVNVKRFMDVATAIFVLLFFSPLYLFVAIGVKISSPGAIFYSHYRVGKNGKPFRIYKFRSMRENAETNGPALAQENDDRITPFGKFLRKMRLDEIPQFYNVLIGDMSLVGPRPERQFFIDKIMERSPHYAHLLKVRPGITSWGQVKYGYAKDVDEMVQRLKYDLIYIENMSIYNDIKILIYTVRTVILAKGL